MPAFLNMRMQRSRANRRRFSLIGAAAVLAALVGPLTDARCQTPATSGEASKPPAVKGTPSTFEPFDLSYVPAEAWGIVGVRPSAALRRPGMERHAEAFQSAVDLVILSGTVLPLAIKAETIEQLVAAVAPPSGEADGPGDSPGAYSLTIHFNADMDWARLLGGLSEEFKTILAAPADHGTKADLIFSKASFEGRTYHKYQIPGEDPPSPGRCFYFPDRRTLVVAHEGYLRERIRRPADHRPELTRNGGWQEIERGLIAVAVDRDGPKDDLRELFFAVMLPFIDTLSLQESLHSPECLFGIDEGDVCHFRLREHFPTADDANRAGRERIKQHHALMAMHALAAIDEDAKDDTPKGSPTRWVRPMLANASVYSNVRAVETATHCRMRLADLADVFAGVTPGQESGVKNSDPGQRETR